MRDILFRAKRKDNGEWVEGFLFKLFYDGIWCIGNEPLSPNDYSEIIGENKDWFYINPDTICQYTGRNDKNGNKIWENDIVSAVWYSYIEPIEDITGTVIFDQVWCAYVICDELMKTKSELNGCEAYTYEFEVLGNVFDNQEFYDEC